MDFLHWSLERARIHPQLQDALITIDGDALSFLLSDGRTFSFRPEVLIQSDAPLKKREELLDRLISIGITNATSAKPDTQTLNLENSAPNTDFPKEAELKNSSFDTSTHREFLTTQRDLSTEDFFFAKENPSETSEPFNYAPTPLIHRAEYFLKSHENGDSLAYLPITENLAVGISTNIIDSLAGVNYSDLDAEGLEFPEIFETALAQLQERAQQHGGLRLDSLQISGAKVFQLNAPANYQLSFFADVTSMAEIAIQLQKEFAGGIPLFIPAAQTKLYIVNSDDPKLDRFLQNLLSQRENSDAVYPLPHILTSGVWQEWIPLPGSRLANTLDSLRNHFRALNYQAQVEMLRNRAEPGTHLDFQTQVSLSRERVSSCIWTSDINVGTLPNSDVIVFGINQTLQPWDDPNDFVFMIRSSVAREIWPEGFTKMENIWPARWRFNSFPNVETWKKLKEASNRQI
ncbi:MAG: hypothetical protein SPG61_00110 [Arcanobacterium sp.]|nr:hypothetical protein [Arcanobacterium sp.]